MNQRAFAEMSEEELRGIICRIMNGDKSENWLNLVGAERELVRRSGR